MGQVYRLYWIRLGAGLRISCWPFLKQRKCQTSWKAGQTRFPIIFPERISGSQEWENAGTVVRKFESANGQCYALDLDEPVDLNNGPA